MSRSLLTLLAALALLCIPRPVHGVTVTVPDDVPTVQQAVDGAAETIVVRASAPVESVTVLRPVTLLAYEESVYFHGELPTLGALTVGPGPAGNVLVRGFRIERGVRSTATIFHDLRTRLEHCRVEAGGVHLASGSYASKFAMLGCIVRGDVVGGPYGALLEVNTIAGGVQFTGHESEVQILGNTILGPAEVGIGLYNCDGTTVVRWNAVSGCEQGIDVTAGPGTWITDNTVEHCDEGGIRVDHSSGYPSAFARVERNQVRDTGPGLVLTNGEYTVRDNVVTDVAGDGVQVTGAIQGVVTGNVIERSQGHGAIALVPFLTEFARNTLIDCAAGGAELEMVVRADSNVIAGCGAFGLRVQAPTGQLLVRMNTLYLNHGPGLDLGGGAGDSLRGNLSSDNDGVGLLWRGAKAPAMVCNDWWNNVGGPTSGVSPGPSDVELAPMFCDALARDLHLSAISPLLALACGPVGALGVGCAEPVAVQPPAGALAPFAARPQPSAGAVRFTWGAGRAGRLDVFDARGARVWSADVNAGAGELRWSGADATGRACAPGVYFARLERGPERRSTRVVLAR